MVQADEDAATPAMKPSNPNPPMPVIVSRETTLTTPFFKLIGKRLEGQAGEPYYSISSLDYVSVVAVTRDGAFVLVRQFRPAVEATTLELPAGHVEAGQQPEEAARAELLEETGFSAPAWHAVGCLRPDTGRLSNRMWVFAATGAERTGPWQPEPGVDVVVASADTMKEYLKQGTFDHALHVASLWLARAQGHIQL